MLRRVSDIRSCRDCVMALTHVTLHLPQKTGSFQVMLQRQSEIKIQIAHPLQVLKGEEAKIAFPIQI